MTTISESVAVLINPDAYARFVGMAEREIAVKVYQRPPRSSFQMSMSCLIGKHAACCRENCTCIHHEPLGKVQSA